MSKGLPFCHIKLDPYEVGVEKTLDLEVGGRRVIYGQGVRARIEVPGQIELDLSLHKGDVVAALRLSEAKGEQTRFVTVGVDRKLVIWSLHGQATGQLSGHRKPLLGLSELAGGRLASWSKDKLVVWDTQELRRIARWRSRARAPEDVFVTSSGDLICFPVRWWKTRIFSTKEAKTLALLNGQAEPLTGVRKLGTGAWVTAAKSGMRRWSARGVPVSPLPVFSLDEGYFEFLNTHPARGGMFIVDDLHALHLLAASGGRLATRAADEAMAKALRGFIRNAAQAKKAIDAKPTHTTFGFRDNPFCDVVAPGEEAKKPVAKSDIPAPDSLWHFFQRPRYEAIQSWLLAEVKAAHDAGDRVHKAILAHIKAARRAQKYAILALASLVPSTLVLIVCREPSQLRAALFAFLVSIGVAVWQRRTANVMAVAERCLAGLPKHIGDFLQEVETQRSVIRAALPCVTTAAVHDAQPVRKRMYKVIANAITKAAFSACELDPTALATVGQKPIILRDWSLLVVPDHPSQVTPNLRSFWWGADGFFVAVERVQVVLPTWDLLHVYSVDYDFAADRSYNEAMHTFYYRDVANIIIRDALRPIALPEGSTTVSAKEMLIVLKSGESATLSALHETSAHALHQAAQKAIGQSLENRRRNLESELSACNTLHRGLVQAELDALGAELLSAAAPKDDSRQGAESAMNDIKQLILAWKVTPKWPSGDDAWPPLWGGHGNVDDHPKA